MHGMGDETRDTDGCWKKFFIDTKNRTNPNKSKQRWEATSNNKFFL